MKMLVQCDRSTLPRFVALDLAKLPPISIDCIDVSSLMRKQQLQDVEIANLKELVQEVLVVTAETSKKLEVSLLPSLRSPSYGAALSTASGPDKDSASSAPSASAPEPVTPEPAPESAPGPSYADVVRDATADPESSEWSVANRRKRAGAPGPGKPADPATSGSNPSTGHRQVRSTGNRAVIGSRKTGPIKAVAAVRRLSVFMSRLPPGTGEEAVRAYVKEQTGADDVTASKLQTKFDSYESYRLDIMNPSCDDVLDPELWAQGLVVRRFFTRRQSSDSEQTVAGQATPALGSGASQ